MLGAYLAEGIGHIVELLLVLLWGPLVLPLGEEVLVVVVSIDGIEEVLQIVEGYSQSYLLLRLPREAIEGESERE